MTFVVIVISMPHRCILERSGPHVGGARPVTRHEFFVIGGRNCTRDSMMSFYSISSNEKIQTKDTGSEARLEVNAEEHHDTT